jgi:hypothetical protein
VSLFLGKSAMVFEICSTNVSKQYSFFNFSSAQSAITRAFVNVKGGCNSTHLYEKTTDET